MNCTHGYDQAANIRRHDDGALEWLDCPDYTTAAAEVVDEPFIQETYETVGRCNDRAGFWHLAKRTATP